MSRKATLVLSGGGAKGIYQVGAEWVLRVEGKYTWERIFGVSVGALNGLMLAQRRYEELIELWLTITEDDVQRRFSWPRILWRLARGAKGVFDHTPLWDLICKHADAGSVRVPVHVGYVDYVSGDFMEAKSEDRADLRKAVWGSASLPVIWPPVKVAGNLALDGGTRNVTPLSRAVESNPTELVVILCSPKKIETAEPPRNFIDVARRALEISMHETFISDLRETLRINALVKQAEAAGAILRKENGSPFKYIPITIIEPTEVMGDTLDFDRALMAERLIRGEQHARALLKGRASCN